MKFLTSLFLFLFLPSLKAAEPQCEIKHNNTLQKLSTVSGMVSGFQSGKVYVTLTNGNRKYTTVAEKEGRWALSFADLENSSEILCWQEGNGLTAKTTLSRN